MTLFYSWQRRAHHGAGVEYHGDHLRPNELCVLDQLQLHAVLQSSYSATVAHALGLHVEDHDGPFFCGCSGDAVVSSLKCEIASELETVFDLHSLFELAVWQSCPLISHGRLDKTTNHEMGALMSAPTLPLRPL
jgi:hypothetical protein